MAFAIEAGIRLVKVRRRTSLSFCCDRPFLLEAEAEVVVHVPQSIASPAFTTFAVDPFPGEIDVLLAEIVKGGVGPWPSEWRGAKAREAALARIDYHGLPAILAGRSDALHDWPSRLVEIIHRRAIGATMWELRHAQVLRDLTDSLRQTDLDALILKGSALAYGFYPEPWMRQRGDSDILVRGSDRDAARAVLRALTFTRVDGNLWPEPQRFQEAWRRRFDDGTSHLIDLHFDLFNSPTLAGRLTFDQCWPGRLPLARIGPNAFSPDRTILLFHGCIHREINRVGRYFVRGRETTGANRIIWLRDIDLLARSLDRTGWERFVAVAIGTDQGEACLAGLDAAARWLKTRVPATVRSALALSKAQSSRYLRQGQLGRALADLTAVPGLRPRLRYASARLLPGARRRIVQLLRGDR